MDLHYTVRLKDADAHLLEVICRVAAPDPAGQRFSLPVWIPGSYLVREFARHVGRVAAECGGRPVAVTKLAKNVWACAPHDPHATDPAGAALSFRYEVYALDLSVRGAYFDRERAYFNGAAVLVRAHGHGEAPCTLELRPPAEALADADPAADWRVATAMPAVDTDARGFGVYRAGDYDELIDHPFEVGRFTTIRFRARGVPHEFVLSGRAEMDGERLGRDLARVCTEHLDLFGPPYPFARYLFLTLAVGEGYGGLEHRASTSLLCARDDLPRPGDKAMGDAYRGFLGLCSHEYFHAWNVKRIKPAAFSPYDLDAENYTRLLWAFEGITSYYDDLALVRAGLISEVSYLELLAQNITRVLRTPGRFVQSLEDASFDAWIKFYRADEDAPNSQVSYYAKGALVALALDLKLRAAGRGSLDEVMRALWARYGADAGGGVPEDGVERLASEVSGLDLREFFDLALRGTEDLPLGELFAPFGISVHLRPAESPSDKGGKAPKEPQEPAGRPRASLGVRTSAAPGGVRLTHVLRDGAAARAGLAAGDVVVAVNGLRAEGERLERQIAATPVGGRVRLHYFRRDELAEAEAVLPAAPEDTCHLCVEGDDGRARVLRRQWLRTVAPAG